MEKKATKADDLKKVLSKFNELEKEMRAMEEEMIRRHKGLRDALIADHRFIVVKVDGRLVVMEKDNAVKHLFLVWPSTKKEVTVVYPSSPDLQGEIEGVLLQYEELGLSKCRLGGTFSDLLKNLEEIQERHMHFFNEVSSLFNMARKELEGDGRFIVFSFRGESEQHIVRKDQLSFVLPINNPARPLIEVDFPLLSHLWSDELLVKYWSLLDENRNLLSETACPSVIVATHEKKKEGFGRFASNVTIEEGFASEGFGSKVTRDTIFTCDGKHENGFGGDGCWKCEREEREALQLRQTPNEKRQARRRREQNE